MSRRDLSGAVDFTVLDRMTGGDDIIAEEVLDLFTQQASMWSALLDHRVEGWRDAVHTTRGAAASIGAAELASICQESETTPQALAPAALDRVRTALDIALGDVAAWRHELALRSLKG